MMLFKPNRTLVSAHIALSAMISIAFSAAAQAQMTPIGTWRSIDDATREPKAQIVVTDQGGVLSGRIDKLLRKGADPAAVCDRCTDDRKDQPILGMEIIRGARKAEGKDVWQGGRILDPEKGSTYSLRLTPIEGGGKLEVRGSIGPFGRTQTWHRIK